jgi:peroxiredoxin Q/BCP
VSVGTRFPAEKLETHTGEQLDLASLRGPAVVYFYPQDNTPGCTKEALAFERLYDEFVSAGVTVVGVSVDDEESHRCFADDHELRFPLVADSGGKLTRRLDVLKDYGEYGELAARVTFLLDRRGVIRRVWEVEDPAAHPEEVLEAARTLAQDTAHVRVAIDKSAGCERLEQRIMRFAPGRSKPRGDPGKQEVLYVASGTGTLHLDGVPHVLQPDMGAFVAAGESYEIENEGPDDLVLVSVLAPQESAPGERRTVTVRYGDRSALPASPNREFRYLVDHEAGCHDVTQFVGVIPPGRAPLHSHTYDEIVYVIEGEGILHMNDRESPLEPGSSVHLPPLREHSLENTGARPMRVLGVFHPAGDPASRASEANS